MDAAFPPPAPAPGRRSGFWPILIVALLAVVLWRAGGAWSHSGRGDAGAGRVRWQDRAKASEISLRARRPILYDFTAAWCGPCRLLDRDWDDAAIAQTVDASFVPVRIVDRQREDGRNAPEIGDLQSKYEISGFPTLVLTAADGRLLGKLEGYRGRAALVKFLNEAPRN